MRINRIFCIGKNYAEHVQELAHLGHAADGDCVVFMKPPSCVVPEGEPIVLPRGRGEVHHEAELVVQLTGGGRDIPLDDALNWVGGITLGLDLTLRELQTTLKAHGKPWELAKAFDGAAPLGSFQPYLEQDLQAIEFTCHVNGKLRQHGRTRDMLFPVARQIHILSQTWALAPGDVIYTGTPKGVGPLKPRDRIVLESPAIGRFAWRCL
ncbi:2-keto-4-pentenoate hydratase/2-oxohepta-3-ene-1,7-dioic acid hydratase (catechol pathway) [Fontimonas thermophila]|uniref:2-keto-4-pentenoate hydratase/2-oxohepta-3-ene-1,7-dioic acid hydratase (Catechol pathway) n=1 Tax=Fontimonas thermophila TaxID=1076937 RepID=A0A1I2JIL1_9GAMM|nr:fumarylacetoacetate hydrolase family protein [Fontimonas thermophila]SFF54705.1 2-keto-4-pentenoate hydratase/2-oxohepta-3-ene-1,7-dioic acid hydratase (catechol pathway) [Fontimonas thermophila]